jgi:hypothetical protein
VVTVKFTVFFGGGGVVTPCSPVHNSILKECTSSMYPENETGCFSKTLLNIAMQHSNLVIF